MIVISYNTLINNTQAQLIDNTLESIANQADVLTSAQVNVGDSPNLFYASSDAVYVANCGSDTVSVIDPTTNAVIENITVGDGPSSIDTFRGAIYVANYGSDTVSVIDRSTNEVVAGVTFDSYSISRGPDSL